MRYLKGTVNLSLTLGRKTHTSVDLIGWLDSNWGEDPDMCHLVGGFLFDIAGGSISWSSKKQPMVALSMVEAEYMAASNATKEAVWLQTLLEDFGYPPVTATVLHIDNQGSIALARNSHSHTCQAY